jgi:hypothetical protein
MHKQPSAVAERLQMVLTEMGVPTKSRSLAAQEELGWTESQAQKTLRGTQYPTVDMLIQLADQHNVCITWLLTGRGQMFLTVDQDESIHTKIQNLVSSVAREAGIDLRPRKFTEVCSVLSRQYQRTQSLDKDLARDLILST